MPSYRVFYLKDRQVTAYRQAVPKPQPYRLKRSNYDEGPEIEASSPYAAWKQLEESDDDRGRNLVVGDVLQIDPASIVVMNFWGFDEAQWQETEPEPDPATDSGPKPEGQTEPAGEAVKTGREGE